MTEQRGSLAVIGAGVIGASLAGAAAARGFAVTLVDVDDEHLGRGLARAEQQQRTGGLAARLSGPSGRSGPAGPAGPSGPAPQRIEPTTSLERIGTAEFIVENVTEDWNVKSALYAEIGKVAGPDQVIAVNTSAIPISRLAELVPVPERVVGVHFMNPVSRIDTVEVVRGSRTSADTLDRTAGLLDRLGKTGVVVADAPGFVINRILMAVVNLAANLVDDAVASPAEVDRLFRGCLGHPMGPLRTADLIGLDTVVRTLDVLHDDLGSEVYLPCRRLREQVADGRLGVKSGEGFFTYGG